jgi:plasmid stabilization system protein ParE
MRRVELRPAARRDLIRFERSLQRRSPRAALRMFDLVTGRILSLGAQPFKGVEAAHGLRELYIRFGKSGFVVRYKVTPDAIQVTRIWHSLENRPR